MVDLDYLIIGHVTRDLTDGEIAIGGTVSYSARTARAMGCRVGVVTSAAADLDLALNEALDGIRLARVPAAETTTFKNVYTADGRRQMLCGLAETLTPESIPATWKAKTVHLGPVAQEIDPALVTALGDAFIGLTPQGWMRRWDRAGNVSYSPWQQAQELLAHADAVVLSEEDVGGDLALIARYAARTRLLVVTGAAEGCTVYSGGQTRHFPAPQVDGVDPTGSGDIFAAAFFIWTERSGDPWIAARFANCVAAHSVTRKGLGGTPDPGEIARCKILCSSQR